MDAAGNTISQVDKEDYDHEDEAVGLGDGGWYVGGAGRG